MSHTPHLQDAPHLTPGLPPDRQSSGTAWSPLRHSLFRSLWIATVVSNIGTWMQNVGAAWLMTALTPSPVMVALVQAATSLPVFLVGLPAGALADVADRRRLLLWTQGWMLAAAAALGLLALAGAITPWGLLLLTFALGVGAALNAPAWQAIVPELVAPADLPAAVALNSVGFNIARAVGPALGGIVVALAGAGAVFLLNAASFLGVMGVLYRWRRTAPVSRWPAEHVLGAIRAGLRYVRYAPPLRAVLVRAGVFIVCGSALWALLPLVARTQLGLDATGYGLLLGALGVGAIGGAVLLPRLRRQVAADALVAAATIAFAAVTMVLVYVHEMALLCGVMMVGGAAWMALMATYNVAVQTAVPDWVRARALAAYLLVFQGGTAAGSALWGTVAARTGLSVALLGAALGLLGGLVVMVRYRLVSSEDGDLRPSLHWPEPTVARPLQPDEGPVLVTVEYHIDPLRAGEFVRAMEALRLARRRDGAMRWGLFNDTADPRRYVETFLVASWVAHLRQHERVTGADRAAQERVHSFHVGPTPPMVSHLLAAHGHESSPAH
ncbi:MAG TPA: MFS transporter [Candidatus Binatia bacterium]|nr:MFS transporter [Candidatus Binatia bacterium]